MIGLFFKKIKFIKKVAYVIYDYTPVRFNNRFINNIYNFIDKICLYNSDYVLPFNLKMIEGRIKDRNLDRFRINKIIETPFGNNSLKRKKSEYMNYNKNFLKLIDLEDDRGFPEDLEMWFKIGLQYKFANVSKSLLRYRLNSVNSVTSRNLRKMELATIKLRVWYGEQNVGYKMSALDKLYCSLMYVSIYIIPSKIKIRLFNFFRNSKK